MIDDGPFEDDLEPVEIAIDGILDLHAFHPREVKDLVHDYLDACLEKGITDVRIIHGKGKGVLRRIVHSALQKSTIVVSYSLADETSGGWGATLVTLRRPAHSEGNQPVS